MALALAALNTDIHPQPHHFPFITPAGMNFFKFYDVTEFKFEDHTVSLPALVIQDSVHLVSYLHGGFPGGGGKVLAFRRVQYLP